MLILILINILLSGNETKKDSMNDKFFVLNIKILCKNNSLKIYKSIFCKKSKELCQQTEVKLKIACV